MRCLVARTIENSGKFDFVRVFGTVLFSPRIPTYEL